MREKIYIMAETHGFESARTLKAERQIAALIGNVQALVEVLVDIRDKMEANEPLEYVVKDIRLNHFFGTEEALDDPDGDAWPDDIAKAGRYGTIEAAREAIESYRKANGSMANSLVIIEAPR